MLILCQMSQICSEMVTYLFGDNFVTIAMVCQINTKLLHFGYCSNKLIRRNCLKTFFLPHRGAKIAP